MKIMRFYKLLPFMFCAMILSACGGGGGSTPITVVPPSAVTPPGAPTLALAYGIKNLEFSWATVDGASHYRLFENPDGGSGFSQVGNDINATNVDHTIALHKRINARYLLEACNSIGCSASSELGLSENLVEAIGYFKASNAEGGDLFGLSGDSFGFAMALSGDGNTLAVGAPFEDSIAVGINGNQADNSAIYSGAVYVYSRSSGGWQQEAYVKASNTEGGDAFGFALALSGDGNTLAVGAPHEDSIAVDIDGNQADNSAVNSGAVYMYSRSSGEWKQHAYVKASNTETDDQFGAAVTLADDGNTLAVGANYESSAALGIGGDQEENKASESGAVYVYSHDSGDWKQQAYVKASNTGANDQFGIALALSGNGDTLAVGAFAEASVATGIDGDQADNSAFESGAVYVYSRSNELWMQQAYIKASNTNSTDFFGGALALSGDGSTLAVGAKFEDSSAVGINGNQTVNGASFSGAVYVYSRSGGGWQQEAYVKASNTAADDAFGRSLSLSGDGNALAVGANGESSVAIGINGDQVDNSAGYSGAVYVFSRSSGEWSQRSYVKASNTGAHDAFGVALDISADGNTLAVGGIYEASSSFGINGDQVDNSAYYSGAVYLY